MSIALAMKSRKSFAYPRGQAHRGQSILGPFGVLVVMAFFLGAVPAQATNGMNMIGYGAVSFGMGGADLAVVDNAAAMNINPAGICGCEGPQLIIGTSILRPQLLHTQATQSSSAEDNNFFLPLLAYVAPLGLGYSSARWKLDLAYEKGFENKLNQASTATAEKHDQETWHAMVTWFF